MHIWWRIRYFLLIGCNTEASFCLSVSQDLWLENNKTSQAFLQYFAGFLPLLWIKTEDVFQAVWRTKWLHAKFSTRVGENGVYSPSFFFVVVWVDSSLCILKMLFLNQKPYVSRIFLLLPHTFKSFTPPCYLRQFSDLEL